MLAAYVFDAAALFVPAVALLLVACLTPLWIGLAARGASLARVLHADRVLEGQPLEATIELRSGPLGLPGAELLDPLVRELSGLRPSRGPLRGRAVIEARVVARFSRRGRRVLDAPALVLGDPLGLVRVMRRGSSPAEELLVLPRTARVRWSQRDPAGELTPATASPSVEALAATDVDGLRPYRPGTPASRISWPALARGAGLLERRLRADRDRTPLVILDARHSGSDADLDAAVRAAASLTLELARRGGCELLLPGDRRPVHIDPGLTAWSAVHIRLALVEGGPAATPPSIGPHTRAGQIFYVTADGERLPGHVLRGGRRASVLVVPSTAPPPVRRSPSFEVSGCSGYLLGADQAARFRERVA